MCKYFEKHEANKIDISDYYNRNDYEFFKRLSTLDLDNTKNHSTTSYFAKSENNFKDFSESRASVR